MIIERAVINRRARRRVNKDGDVYVWRAYVRLASSVVKGASPADDKTDDRLKKSGDDSYETEDKDNVNSEAERESKYQAIESIL